MKIAQKRFEGFKNDSTLSEKERLAVGSIAPIIESYRGREAVGRIVSAGVHPAGSYDPRAFAAGVATGRVTVEI